MRLLTMLSTSYSSSSDILAFQSPVSEGKYIQLTYRRYGTRVQLKLEGKCTQLQATIYWKMSFGRKNMKRGREKGGSCQKNKERGKKKQMGGEKVNKCKQGRIKAHKPWYKSKKWRAARKGKISFTKGGKINVVFGQKPLHKLCTVFEVNVYRYNSHIIFQCTQLTFWR